MIHKYSVAQLREMGVAEFHINNWFSTYASWRERLKSMKYCHQCGDLAQTWTGHVHTDKQEKVIAGWCNNCYPHDNAAGRKALAICDSPEPKHCCYGFRAYDSIEFIYPTNEAILSWIP